MGRGRNLRPEIVARIRELRAEGYTIRDIAHDIGKTTGAVQGVLYKGYHQRVRARRVADLPIVKARPANDSVGAKDYSALARNPRKDGARPAHTTGNVAPWLTPELRRERGLPAEE